MIMDYHDVKRLALILAVQAEIDGMKAHNDIRKANGHEPDYSLQYFFEKSYELVRLANAHNDQL